MVAALAVACGAGSPASADEPRAGPRVPSALAWASEGRLLVALREARAIAVVDPRGWTVAAEWPLEFRPVSLAATDDGKGVLVGGADGEAAVLGPDGHIVVRLPRGRGPTRVLALDDRHAAVASQWDAAVRRVDWRDGRVVAIHPLPFPPGRMARIAGGRLVVADAFAGRLAVIVPDAPARLRVHTFEGSGLHGLTVADEGRELLIAHMEQDEPAAITAANIDRGAVLSSRLSAVMMADLDAEPRSDSLLPRRQIALDGPVHGAADPSAMAVSRDGTRVFIALSGAHQVLKNDRTLGSPARGSDGRLPLGHNQRLAVLEVGRSPVAIVLDETGRLAITADSMSDTLSVVDTASLGRVATVPLGPTPVARTAAQRGEALFLDGRRALDRWMSCASCHIGGHTSGLSFDTLGDGGYGAPKNTPSLLGVGGTEPYAWTGAFPGLPEQVHQSLESSLRGPAPSERGVRDLVAFLETLQPPPPVRMATDPAALRGAEVFHARRCDTCHRPPLYTIPAVRDVGLDDGAGGHRRFNPPSLRGVGWSAPYLHDGRAATLADVLDQHSPGQTRPLTADERAALAAYLESL